MLDAGCPLNQLCGCLGEPKIIGLDRRSGELADYPVLAQAEEE